MRANGWNFSNFKAFLWFCQSQLSFLSFWQKMLSDFVKSFSFVTFNMLWPLNLYLLVFPNLFALQTADTDWLILGLKTYRGMSTMVVTPPAAAALVAVQKPSHEVRPGSFTWTWQSTTPGMTTLSPTSSTCGHSELSEQLQPPSKAKYILRSATSIHLLLSIRETQSTEHQLTSQPTSRVKLWEESIWCIFPSFIMTTAGLISSPTSTRLLLTAATCEPSFMAVLTEWTGATYSLHSAFSESVWWQELKRHLPLNLLIWL